jgi:hypothetical protein
MQNIQHILDIEVKYWTFNTYVLSTLKLIKSDIEHPCVFDIEVKGVQY